MNHHEDWDCRQHARDREWKEEINENTEINFHMYYNLKGDTVREW